MQHSFFNSFIKIDIRSKHHKIVNYKKRLLVTRYEAVETDWNIKESSANLQFSSHRMENNNKKRQYNNNNNNGNEEARIGRQNRYVKSGSVNRKGKQAGIRP